MRGRWLWVVGVLLLGASGTADAKPKAKGKAKAKPQVVALFPLLRQNEPDEATVAAVETLVEKASTLVEGINVIAGKKLSKKIKGDPAKLIEKCGGDPKCFAKLGKKAGAKEVLLGRAAPRDGGGVRIQFLAIDVKGKSISRKLPLEFPSADDVKSVLRGSIYELFGVADPNPGSMPVAAAEPPPTPTEPPKNDDDLLDGSAPAASDGAEELPLTLALETPAPAPTPVAAETPPPGPTVTEPTAGSPPVATSEPSPTPAASDQPTGLLAAVPPTSDSSPPPPAEPRGRSHVLRWLGVGLAGVGVAVAGTGGYFGMQSKSAGDSINDGSPSQLEVLRRQADANAQASRANLLMIGGGAAAAVGAILFGVDAMLLQPRLEVSIGGSNGVSLILPW